MSDRWLNIYHIYHSSITRQVQMDCPKSVLLFGHSMPTAWDQVQVNHYRLISLPLINKQRQVCSVAVSGSWQTYTPSDTKAPSVTPLSGRVLATPHRVHSSQQQEEWTFCYHSYNICRKTADYCCVYDIFIIFADDLDRCTFTVVIFWLRLTSLRTPSVTGQRNDSSNTKADRKEVHVHKFNPRLFRGNDNQ